jgi:hypothetical protein
VALLLYVTDPLHPIREICLSNNLLSSFNEAGCFSRGKAYDKKLSSFKEAHCFLRERKKLKPTLSQKLPKTENGL